MRNRLYTAVILLLLAIFISSSFYILNYFFNSNRESKQYTKLKNQITEQTEEIPVNQYQSLYDINSDLVGWLTIDNTRIDYPVVKSQEDNYYLKHNFYKEYSDFGCPYTQGDMDADNIIIYGHNMKNGSMFGKLKQMYESEKYKDSKYLWICTPNGKYRYEIFSMQYAKVGSDVYTLFSAHDEQFEAYVKKMAKQSKVDMKALGLGKDDYVVTLSTCTSDESVRFVVQARWVGTYK